MRTFTILRDGEAVELPYGPFTDEAGTQHPVAVLDRWSNDELATIGVVATDVAEPPPAVVSRLQAKMALADAELLDAVEAAVAAAPAQIRIYWAEASDFHRAHPAIEQMRLAMGWTPEQLDDLFVAAALVV